MKIKLIDIAEHMGISVAAVSMAINNKKGVSEETREEVLKVADKLGYVIRKTKPEKKSDTKALVKLLRLKRHGLVVMETAFFAQVIEGIEEACKKMGYELLISNLVINDEEDLVTNEVHKDIEGLIILGTELEDEDTKLFESISCPKVVLDRKFMDNINTVMINNQKAVFQGIECFYKHGHTNIGYLKSSQPIYNFDSRYRSYLTSMDYFQLKLEDPWIIPLKPTIEGAFEDMKMYLESVNTKDLPTAFMADNDNIALGAMNALKEHGILIPERVSLIGIDDMPFCRLISPQLTTIKVYKHEIGRQAVKLLAEQMNNETDCTMKVEVDTCLIERDSVKTVE